MKKIKGEIYPTHRARRASETTCIRYAHIQRPDNLTI